MSHRAGTTSCADEPDQTPTRKKLKLAPSSASQEAPGSAAWSSEGRSALPFGAACLLRLVGHPEVLAPVVQETAAHLVQQRSLVVSVRADLSDRLMEAEGVDVDQPACM